MDNNPLFQILNFGLQFIFQYRATHSICVCLNEPTEDGSDDDRIINDLIKQVAKDSEELNK